ncbi:MAG: hypothetical protein LUC83_09525 [Clostridiales bacterium]|nr:hypothetical protein [Clostridiales bacterium]
MGEDYLKEIKEKMEKDSYWSKIPLAALRAFHSLFFKSDGEKTHKAEKKE